MASECATFDNNFPASAVMCKMAKHICDAASCPTLMVQVSMSQALLVKCLDVNSAYP